MKTISAVIFVMLLGCSTSFGHDANATSEPGAIGRASGSAPAKPTKVKPAITPRTTPSPHQFFDFKNSFAAGAFAVGLAGDSWSTQHALAYPGTREANPLARPFVTSRTGEAVYSGSSLGLLLVGMYLAHKTQHHKL